MVRGRPKHRKKLRVGEHVRDAPPAAFEKRREIACPHTPVIAYDHAVLNRVWAREKYEGEAPVTRR